MNQSLELVCAEAVSAHPAGPENGGPRRNSKSFSICRQTQEASLSSEARPASRVLKSRTPVVGLCLVLTSPLFANSGNLEDLSSKYENLLLFQSSDYESSAAAKPEFEDVLLPLFRRAVRNAVTSTNCST